MRRAARLDQPAVSIGARPSIAMCRRTQMKPHRSADLIDERQDWAAPEGRPISSDLDRFGYCQGIFEFDAEVADGAVHLRVPEQQLDGPKVPGLAVDLRDLGATH